MYIEGFVAQELNRIRHERFYDEANAWRRARLSRPSHSGSGIRASIGDLLIRAGGHLSGIQVDPCLSRAGRESPAGA